MEGALFEGRSLSREAAAWNTHTGGLTLAHSICA
jgi:hypothetical protein